MNDKVRNMEENDKDSKCESCGKLFDSYCVKKHICEICSKDHCSNNCLNSHLNTIHNLRISYKCEICSK